MWEWFTTKPFVDAGEARFVRRLLSRRPRAGRRSPTAFLSDVVDRLRAHALAVLADRRAPDARTRRCAAAVPRCAVGVRALVRRARGPRARRRGHRIHQGQVRLSRGGRRGPCPSRSSWRRARRLGSLADPDRSLTTGVAEDRRVPAGLRCHPAQGHLGDARVRHLVLPDCRLVTLIYGSCRPVCS